MRYAAPIMASTVSAITESFITELSIISSSPSLRPNAREEGLPDQVRPDAREVPLQQLGVAVEDQLGDPAVQHRVAEELQPSVRVVRVRDAGVGEGALPQRFRQDAIRSLIDIYVHLFYTCESYHDVVSAEAHRVRDGGLEVRDLACLRPT